MRNTISQNQEFKTFLRVFYLALPDEVNARVQEIGKELKTLETKSGHETMEYLKKTRIFSDAEKMFSYIPNLTSINNETLTNFVKNFNDRLIRYSKPNLKIVSKNSEKH